MIFCSATFHSIATALDTATTQQSGYIQHNEHILYVENPARVFLVVIVAGDNEIRRGQDGYSGWYADAPARSVP